MIVKTWNIAIRSTELFSKFNFIGMTAIVADFVTKIAFTHIQVTFVISLVASFFGGNSHGADSLSSGTLFATFLVYVQQCSILANGFVALPFTRDIRTATIWCTVLQIENVNDILTALTNTLRFSFKEIGFPLTFFTWPKEVISLTPKFMIVYSKLKTMVSTGKP